MNRFSKSSRSSIRATVTVRQRRTTSAYESFDEPLAVVPHLRSVAVEHDHRLLEVRLRVRVDLLVGEDRPLGRAAGRVADAGRVVADDQHADVPGVLERAHALQRDRAADVDVGRRDVDAELDPQRPAELQLRLETALGQHVDRVPREVGEHRGGYTTGRFGALPQESSSAQTSAHPQAQAARTPRRAALLGFAAFTFGLLVAIAAQIPDLDPARQTQHQQKDTYVYASDGKTILAILRGSQSRIVVDSEDISPWLKHAIVAVEDKRFYEHRGVDVRGIMRAV